MANESFYSHNLGAVERLYWSTTLLRLVKFGYEGVTKIVTNHAQVDDSPAGKAYDFVGQQANHAIATLLTNDSPCMITRFGATELNCVAAHYMTQYKRFDLETLRRYLMDEINVIGWRKSIINNMSIWSGFFPTDQTLLERFADETLQNLSKIDILVSWLKEEKHLETYLSNVTRISIDDFEPFFFDNPWTKALEGKTVLVIHPFERSIQSQYNQRHLLFKNPDILPNFTLKTIKAVQSIANSHTEFATWFDALDSMCKQIDQTEFDVALIGAGAYGMHLAAHVKSIGKKAVHMGGVLQVLFGIKGARWDNKPKYAALQNEHWIRPAKTETPTQSNLVEGGCYW
ncbi:hypothetical protein BN8_06533 [Fibrisoma limi BUZ 3]|uniref:Uncharacterized protein n=1 Tax=Fibrisoma limi BUZ 3 TaxID=1185876 RepID=I2GTA0_9BACT|nr:hypothetical protein [Fibrisoma limi]CCH57129.1 hypothetical protein BN8_06533 [Fibrisoma limi BUZ 3]